MIIKQCKIEGLFTIELNPIKDNRGFFLRSFCKKELSAVSSDFEIVQVNQTLTFKKGAVRGLHFQIPPYAEKKLIRCLSGSILDFAVDIRFNSPTFLQYYSIILSKNNFQMFLIPKGFAHGFQVLEDNTELLYFHSQYYNKEAERSLNILDPKLSINLPLKITDISDKDKAHKFIDNNFKGIKL